MSPGSDGRGHLLPDHSGGSGTGQEGDRIPTLWQHFLPYVVIVATAAAIVVAAEVRLNSHLATAIYLLGGLVIELGLVHQMLAYRALKARTHRSTRLESLADADPVTSLLNHRALVARIEHEIARSGRYDHPCSVLFLDLDHFKALNDTFGHHAGDKALHEFGAVVRMALRDADTLGRWGGEEFLAILPETDREAALAAAERIRSSVADHTFWAVGGGHLTCSVGVATYPDDASRWDALLAMADQAMYSAKRLGRNRVCSVLALSTVRGGELESGRSREDAALQGIVDALSALVEARDRMTGEHGSAVAELAVRVAQALDRDSAETQMVQLAAQLHDLGKVAVPDAILRKPGPLTQDEWQTIRQHPTIGADVVDRVPSLRMLAPIVRAHHERWDGTGYPDRLQGPAIPFAARIISVVDAYLAMTADRPYQQARTCAEAVAELQRHSGSQFDPEVVDALLGILERDLRLHGVA